ncbi:MAG: hypothetical protein AB7F76_12705 [Parvibaculaceae bacterium]
MDWSTAITRNRQALEGIVEALFAMLGLAGGVTVDRIPRALHSAVLRVLRPAESAVRRLIVIAARGLVVKPRPSRPMPAGPIIGRRKNTRASFRLFDPRKTFTSPRRRAFAPVAPRIHVFTADPRVMALRPTPPPAADPALPPDGLVNSTRLATRLAALKLALDDLPRQARRLVRWRMKREKAKAPKFTSPLRPGHPPGYRRRPAHPVDKVLAECHALAFDAMRPDTS